MIIIEVPDMNDSVSAISIGNIRYRIRFTYNTTYDYWNFGIEDSDGEPIVEMTKIVPNYPIMFFYEDWYLPNGTFACMTDLEKVGRDDFKNGLAQFVYLAYDE